MTHNFNRQSGFCACGEHVEDVTVGHYCDRSIIDPWALMWGAVFSAPFWFLLFVYLLKSHGV